MSIPTVLDQFPTPECAKLLGLDVVAADKEKRWVRIAFDARSEFLNAGGTVQGGFLSAMLDDAMGPAVLIATDAALYPTTITLTVNFLAPARPGRIFAEARVLTLGRTVGFIESGLEDESGREIAQASASVRLLPLTRIA